MADVAVELPPQPPHKKHLSATSSYIENTDLLNGESGDPYSSYKKLQRELEYIRLQEEYIKDEQRYGFDKSKVNSCMSH